MRTMRINFTTSNRHPDEQLFIDRKKLITRGSQLQTRWMGTWYRVKGNKQSGFNVFLDKPIKGNQWVILKYDESSCKYLIVPDKVFVTKESAIEHITDTDMTDCEIIYIYR